VKERIAVLMGGRSLEREVSLKSGERVWEALKAKGYEAKRMDVDERLVPTLADERIDLAYIALHGKYGEDGTIQEMLEILDIPYTGPGVLSSMVGFDKVISKQLFEAEGVPTPSFYGLSSGAFKEIGASAVLPAAVETLGLPLVVKPARQGSALGIKFAHTAEDLPNALISALSYDDKVVLEKYVHGTELAVSVLDTGDGAKALPVVEIVTKREFFDFESMYTMGMTEYFVPARIDEALRAEVQELGIRVHTLLRCRDVSRVDMIVDEAGQPFVLELNTSPGMTETSLLPMAAAEAGISFEDLVEDLVRMGLARRTS
jgi:D-alanine-D-alanine ligase